MTGKETCAILKQIRRDVAKQNDINLRIDECTHKGECKGTCPRCEAEVRALEEALAERKKRGQRVAVAGVSAGLIAFNLAACQPIGNVRFPFGKGHNVVDVVGKMPAQPDDEVPLMGEPAVDPNEQNGDQNDRNNA